MQVTIRVDASQAIGTGHVMRCLTLANALTEKGAQVCFVCRELQGHLCGLIEARGFTVFRLPAPHLPDTPSRPGYASWLGVSEDQDARETLEAIAILKPDWLVVDHYALGRGWEAAMRSDVGRILAVDDLARAHDCDLLLDQNYFQDPEKRYQGLLPSKCHELLGPTYALLRPEFRQARKFCRMRGNGIVRVLIYFGGNDPDNLTGMALEALSDNQFRHLLVDAVIGPNNPHQDKLEKLAQQRPGTRLHIQPEGFIELMLRADLCIGAGGTTTWERICLDLPSLVITVAENQEAFTNELNQKRFVAWVGRQGAVSASDINKALVKKIIKPQYKNHVSCFLNPVDGLGALRVAEKIVPSEKEELSLRKVSQEDMELYYFWANDPKVRKNSFQQEQITWNKHVAWFRSRLGSPSTEMWLMQTPSGLPVGQVRFDIDGETVNISYSLDPVARGRGWGVRLVELGINKVSESGNGIMIQGKVKKGNHASRKIFFNLGFSELVDNDLITFRKIIQ